MTGCGVCGGSELQKIGGLYRYNISPSRNKSELQGYHMNEFENEVEQIKRLGIKNNSLRLAYEEKVRALKNVPQKLRAEGLSEEQIAREMQKLRRELGRQFKEAAPPLFREYIYAATAAKYGDPLGPTYEMLREKKTCEQIIESATRPIDDLDNRLTLEGFQTWYVTSGAVSPKQPGS